MTSQPAPAPAVQYLPALFRRVHQGEIREPAFQREFVWKEKQILALLESVFNGFPIGSLLLWKVERRMLRIESSFENAFPDVEEVYPLSYILDGMQRLSALYGVCNYSGDKNTDDKYNVIFDLEKRIFLHYDTRTKPRYFVRMADLFSPRRLIETQGYLSSQEGGDRLIETTIELYSIFQEYLVPTVTISGREVSEIVQIFERINTTGTPLSPVHFMRAVTWSERFDLNDELRRMQSHAEEMGFSIPEGTLMKLLGISLGKLPLSDQLLSLRAMSDVELHRGVATAGAALEGSIVVLRERFGILSYDYVPYEGQMLVLTKLVLLGHEDDEAGMIETKRWFWSASFNEELQGKPDHYIANLAENAAVIPLGIWSVRQRLDERDFEMRLFTKGKAFSSAVAAMFAMEEARSLWRGEVIRPEVYMADFSQEHFGRVLPRVLMRGDRSDRVMANMVVVTELDRLTAAAGDALTKRILELGSEGQYLVLDSQFIPTAAVECLAGGDTEGFLRIRSGAMLAAARRMMLQEAP